MKAQLKCSNCGAEISNINMSWGQKQWLWVIPFMILALSMPFLTEYVLKETHDFRSDLSVKDLERRYVDGMVEILGVVENHGKVGWQHIAIKAELFSKDGKFLDQLISHNNVNLSPGTSEHFKLSAHDFPESRWKAITDAKVKISSASHSRFAL